MKTKTVKQPCWQCRSRERVYDEKHKVWRCKNNCGPKSLGELLRL